MSLFNIYYDHVNETHRRTLTDPRTCKYIIIII